MKSTFLTAIDVGTTKVITTIAEVDNGKIRRIAGIGVTPSSGMHKGLVVGIQDAKQAIRESVKKAEFDSGCRVTSAYIGVTGRHVSSLNRRGAVVMGNRDRAVRFRDIKRVIQNARHFHIPDGQRLLHIIPRSYAVNGGSGVKDPVGLSGQRLDVETHVITAAAASMKNIASCIEGLGIGIDELVLEPLASSEAVLTEEEKQQGVILADIGGGTTDVAVFRDGSIWHTAIISVAGYQLTRDIAVGTGLPFNAAERLKKEHGGVAPMIEGQLESNTKLPGETKPVSYQEVRRILRARVEEILGLIILELPQSDYGTLVPNGLVLTGGSSNLAGIDMLGKQVLRLPVRVGRPIRVPGIIDDKLIDPAYATNIGLLLWGAKRQIAPELRARGLNDNFKRLMTQLKSISYLVRRLPTWNR